MTSALEYRDVSVHYGNAADAVIHSLSLDIEPGERVALLGLNGSGKTSLLLATVGLIPFDGTIAVNGTKLEKTTVRIVRSNVGFLFSVPEDQLLFPNVLDDVSFGAIRAGLTKSEARERALQVMTELGVADLANVPLHRLSHGQKQRIALAGSLVTNPPLLLLDEPSAGLDPPAKRQLAKFLSLSSAAQLIATHDIVFASRVCRRYVLLEQGRIRLDGKGFEEIANGFGR